MKRVFALLLALVLICAGCSFATSSQPPVAATTLPVYQFTTRLCAGTGIEVSRVISEPVSCLHDYSLSVNQMRTIEGAQILVLSGGGLEDFMEDVLAQANATIDASRDLELLPGEEEWDPHFWLSPDYAMKMAQTICNGLCKQYPSYEAQFQENLTALLADLTELQAYGQQTLSDLRCRELITFHDGFSYFAQAFNLTILAAVEEESGSEASAAELTELIQSVKDRALPAIFVEANGSTAAASVISSATGVPIFTLDMAIAGDDYFTSMYNNIDTIKEALG